MTPWAAVLSDLAGASIVLLTVRDVVHELFHPGGTGSISRTLQRSIWAAMWRLRVSRRRALALAGPTMLLAVVTTWTVLLAVGWALIFWPYLPAEFRFASPLAAQTQACFGDALYFSAVALTTLGFGDITPTQPLLRLLATLEAAIGFAMLTVGISWTLSIYPVLGRRRSLALRAVTLHSVSDARQLPITSLNPVVAAGILGALAAELDHALVDLIHSGITYYFDDARQDVALSAVLPFLARVASDGMRADADRTLQFAAATLHRSLAGFASYLASEFLHMRDEPLAEVLAAYAQDQAHAQLQ